MKEEQDRLQNEDNIIRKQEFEEQEIGEITNTRIKGNSLSFGKTRTSRHQGSSVGL